MHCEFILSFGYPADPAVLNAPNRSGGPSLWSGWSTTSAGARARRPDAGLES